MINNFKEGLTTIVSERFTGSLTIDGLIDYLLQTGIITCQTALRYVVKDEYYKRLKKQDANCFEIKLNLSIKYDVSKTTIENIIYKYPHIIV